MSPGHQSRFSHQKDYPWSQSPLIVSAPMRLISGPSLAMAVSRAGGLGFIGAGSDLSNLSVAIEEASTQYAICPIPNVPVDMLPIGIGFLNWGADLETAVEVLSQSRLKPAAVWFFAPNSAEELILWTIRLREATDSRTKIWIQVGTVASSLEAIRNCTPDVLVVQGSDAGGHGLAQSSSVLSLLPEVEDAIKQHDLTQPPLIAAGGIADGRGVAAALMLGASGVCMGTRFLVSKEADISHGYREAVIAAKDGGITTVRTTLYDKLRGTKGWPAEYNGRGVKNKSFRDWEAGLDDEQNAKLYDEALNVGDRGWRADSGRLTTYAGTGVGLVKRVQEAGQIVLEIRMEVKTLMMRSKL